MNAKTGDQKIDAGFALCHCIMGLEEKGIAQDVLISDPGITVPEGAEYIATVHHCIFGVAAYT